MTDYAPWGRPSTADNPSLKDLQARVDRHIKPELMALEQENAIKIGHYYMIVGATLILTFVMGYFLLKMNRIDMGDLIWGGFPIYGAYLYAKRPLDKLGERAKVSTMNSLCGFLGLTYRVVPEGVSLRRLIEIDLIPSYHEKTLEDQIVGDVRGVDFSLFEAKLVRVSRGHKGGSWRVTVFQGLLCEFDFHKNFTGTTIITQDHTEIGNLIAKFGKVGERIRLEDPEFEQEFEVYGTDQVESRYLLTRTRS